MERFWKKVDKSGADGCWIWTAHKNPDGYGQFRVDHQTRYAHIVSYVMVNGPVPDGLELDHLCRNRACVNPDHLEAVSDKVNSSRGLCGVRGGERQRAKTHCPQGHEYTEANTRIDKLTHRHCRECHRIQSKRNMQLKRQH